jgi:hypothetical protein
MKGIARSLGDMNIQIKSNDKLVKRRIYQLNPKYEEKVRKELDQMLDDGIIVPVEESNWIIHMVVQPNKTSDI